jgi:hypothetical protein
MTAVIGVVIALLIAFVLLSIFFLVAYKQQKLCFKGGEHIFLCKSCRDDKSNDDLVVMR